MSNEASASGSRYMSASRTAQWRQSGAGEARPGQRQHRLRGVHAEPLRHARRQQFQHAAGAGADVEQAARRIVRHQREQGGFDGRGGEVEGAHFVPVGALVAETFVGGAGALGQDAGGLAAVGFQDGVVLGEVGGDLASQRTIRTGGEGKPGVGTFAFARQQAGFAEQFQVAGEAGLGLAEDFGELGDAEGASRGEREEAEAGGLRGGAERGEQGVHRDVSDIKICLCL